MAFALGARAACLSVPVNAALSRQRRRRPGLSLGRSSKPLVRASVGGEPPSGPRMEESSGTSAGSDFEPTFVVQQLTHGLTVAVSGSEGPSTALQTREPLLPFQLQEEEGQRSAVQSILYPDPSQLPDGEHGRPRACSPYLEGCGDSKNVLPYRRSSQRASRAR